ncbi:MAG: hypothetical protein ACK53Y_00960, partial [bacterium]
IEEVIIRAWCATLAMPDTIAWHPVSLRGCKVGTVNIIHLLTHLTTCPAGTRPMPKGPGGS